jgi:alkanesulfonate monooxygenase SsuD/methylene tetrahydromethanopterin reductase-like flavin-dependent oxidoreductase (luciferase family)
MTMPMPAISLAAVPGRRRAMIEFAQQAEQRGFAGIYLPSLGDNMALATVLATATQRITFGTSIMPIYFRAPLDLAQTAAFVHELSGGRFRFGVGISHAPAHARHGVTPGKPLADIRAFVKSVREAERIGEAPPIILATLRKRMLQLAGEIGDGLVFANGSRSHMAVSLAHVPHARRTSDDFFIGNMIPTCVSDDIQAAAAVNRKTLSGYVRLENYRNYWREAGYEQEMDAVESAITTGANNAALSACLSDKWLADNTLYGPADKVLEGLEAWYDAGIKTPILVPSSAAGNQLKAIQEVFDLCERLG